MAPGMKVFLSCQHSINVSTVLPCQSGGSHLLCNDFLGRRDPLPAVAVLGSPGLRLYLQDSGPHLRGYQWQYGTLCSDHPLSGQLGLVPSTPENYGHRHLLATTRER